MSCKKTVQSYTDAVSCDYGLGNPEAVIVVGDLGDNKAYLTTDDIRRVIKEELLKNQLKQAKAQEAKQNAEDENAFVKTLLQQAPKSGGSNRTPKKKKRKR